MKVCSLFCGIGGIDLAFEQAGHEIVWANDNDKFACMTYRYNFSNVKLVEADIRSVDKSTIPDCDIVTAGFPCQPFSVCGKQKGFNDKYIDVLATIGDECIDKIGLVQQNDIEEKYKRIIKYEELVEETKSLSAKKQFDALPKKIKVFNKEKSSQIDFDFKFNGWIGTVKNEESFKSLLADDGYSVEDIEDKDIIVVDDNRISIYSRGKVGEYNILPKLKTKAANDAYIIGEIFVDDFEDDSLLDMATSNRRG